MDHAKALADALRDLLDWADEYMRYGKAPTYDQPGASKKALAAYDTHPVEAAARENGELHFVASKLCANVHPHDSLRKDDPIHDFYAVRRAHVHALMNALSTHQQQGAEREVMKTALCVLRGIENSGDPYLALHPNTRKDVAIAIDGLRDSLSRAQQAELVSEDELLAALNATQPDMVTEAYNGHDAQHHVALVLHGKFGAQCGMGEVEMWVPIARAAIEAIAARGRAG